MSTRRDVEFIVGKIISGFSVTEADEIPKIDLYMDQVLQFLSERLRRTARKSEADKLLTNDNYLLCADFRSYVDMQAKVAKEYQNKKAWAEKAILNVARMGKFSSDRTIKQYAEEIWNAKPCSIKL